MQLIQLKGMLIGIPTTFRAKFIFRKLAGDFPKYVVLSYKLWKLGCVLFNFYNLTSSTLLNWSKKNQTLKHLIVFSSQTLVIGVRKCGTRALLEMLYLHPRIQKAAGEVHFFDRDENYWKGLEWYRKKMPHSFRGQITIEKSPSYFVMPEVSISTTIEESGALLVVGHD